MSTATLNSATASVQELQMDFASVARKIEEFGHIVITHDGVPSYEMTPIAKPPAPQPAPQPDYMARLLKRQPKPMSEEATRAFWEHERGDRC